MTKIEAESRIDERAKLLSETLHQESDRGCVLLGAEILSNDLELLLRTFFRVDSNIVKKTIDPLFKGFGPLSTFAAKIEISYAMGLLPNVAYERLNLVRKLRNLFAHSATQLDLSNSKCKPILDKVAGARGFRTPEEEAELEEQKLTRKELKSRLKFVFVVIQLSTIMVRFEERLKAGQDIRQHVLASEKARAFEYD